MPGISPINKEFSTYHILYLVGIIENFCSGNLSSHPLPSSVNLYKQDSVVHRERQISHMYHTHCRHIPYIEKNPHLASSKPALSLTPPN